MPVLVEGMYPTRDGSEEYLMSTWQEYIDVMNSGLCYAIDLSHLHIVANREGQRPDWVYQLITHSNCKEVHVSHNNGRSDAHRPISERIWDDLWWKEAWLSALADRPSDDQPSTSRKGCIELVHTGTTSLRRPKETTCLRKQNSRLCTHCRKYDH